MSEVQGSSEMPAPEFAAVQGVMWCVRHDGVADELNDGEVCNTADGDDCVLIALYVNRAEEKALSLAEADDE